MARKKTGTIVTLPDGRMQAIISLKDGSRKRLPPFPKGTSRAMALERTALHAERAIAKGTVGRKRSVPSPRESGMDKWFTQWIQAREARGFTAVQENRAHFAMHISPVVGDTHVKEWTRDDLRSLSRHLDAKVQGKVLSWKSAINVWATATKMVGDAAESKHDGIRCRTDNPATGVEGPDRGDDVGEQYLYPSEFLKFMECAEVPEHWKQIVALAIYLYPRDAELRSLVCRDLDLEHASLRITKALNRRTNETKATKGRRSRSVSIEPNIMPLIKLMKGNRPASDPFITNMPSERDMARGLRRWLLRAGVDRHELHHRTPTTRPIRFHDLRATGLTWMAIRGDDHLKIQHRAGHTDFATTQRYIRMAEAVREGFGDPFPGLPAEFNRSAEWIGVSRSGRNSAESERGGRDSKPSKAQEDAQTPRKTGVPDRPATQRRELSVRMLIADQLAIDHETCGGMYSSGRLLDAGLAHHLLGVALRGMADRAALRGFATGEPRGQA